MFKNQSYLALTGVSRPYWKTDPAAFSKITSNWPKITPGRADYERYDL